MATAVYRFIGDKKKGYFTGAIDTLDANGIKRHVGRNDTIELTDTQVADLRRSLVLNLSTDPTPSAPMSDHAIAYSELIDPQTGKIKSSLISPQVVTWDGSWPATRPATPFAVAAIGPTAPPWLLEGDSFTDTDAIQAAGGSFKKNIGMCRTTGAWEFLTAARAPAANQILYMRLEGEKIDSVGAQVGIQLTDAAPGHVCYSLHASSGVGEAAVPGARKATTGIVNFPAAGFPTVPWLTDATLIDNDAKEGDWLAIATDSAVGKFYGNGALFPRNEISGGIARFQNAVVALTDPAPVGTSLSTFWLTGKVV
jgi:hypothetical protein